MQPLDESMGLYKRLGPDIDSRIKKDGTREQSKTMMKRCEGLRTHETVLKEWCI